MEENEALPDDLRCNRTDGRQWRCKRRVVEGKKLCEIHYVQGRHRQLNKKVPESLKIVRNTKNKNRPKIQNPKGSLEIGFSKSERALRIMKRRKPLKHKPCVSEALDEALRRMELKRGDLPLELIRVFLKRQIEKKNEKELKNESAEVMTEFPNALMAIPVIPAENFNNAGSVLDVKLGLDSSSNPFPFRRFRSKNIEPLPICTMQAMPFARNRKNLSKVKRRLCHWCRRSSYRVLIKCSSCKKQYFCLDCIKERYLEQQEIRGKCPVCRRACSCRICQRSELKPSSHKELYKHKRKVSKVQLLYYLVHLLLPVLGKINEEQRIEVEIEAKISGKGDSDIQIQQASAGDGKLYHCSNCNTSILDYHRICSKCSYSLCLYCCRESRHGSLTEDCKSEGSNEEQACSSNFERQSRRNHTSTSRQSFLGIHYPSSKSCSNYQACADGSISCPPAEYGGCSDSFLDLRCVFPYTWIKELEISAEAILCSHNIQDIEHDFSSCSLCRGSDHKDAVVNSFIKVDERPNSRDKFLYCPSIKNLREENLEHFQKHWGEGHPIIVRNVLRNSSDLSWDPVVMFCTYLEKRSKCSPDKETAKAQNHSDWCEVEIARKQIFMGSIEWQTHATMQREMVKFRAWLSSHLFQEQFPAHHAEILRALPLQEYMNPKSGLLNLAVKLPPEMPEPDLGPSIYISYGGPEELSQAEFTTNLCYESYDVVNILASATDVLVSKEQVRKIKCLMKNKKPQDQKENTSYSSDQKGKSSLHSGDTEESGLQDATGEQLPDGIAEVPFYSGDSQKGQTYEDQDGNISSDNENDSESESDVSLFCSGSVERSEDSDSDYLFKYIDGAKKEAKTSGAQWDVFRRQDVPKLLEYLKRHSSEFTSVRGYSKQVHPILDRSFFFDAFHKLRLKEEFDVQPWTFEQHLGEAIIIPAGCPYQVKQLKSCINVVLDFISPENVAECINITDEIRLLPEHHKARGKMLEVKKMVLCGMNNAIAEIRELTHTKQSS